MKPRSATRPAAIVGVAIGGALLLGASIAATAIADAGDQTPGSRVATSAMPAKDGTVDTSVLDPDEVARQEQLESHAARLNGLLEAAENFGGSAFDLDAYAYDMWWRGDVPPDVQNVLDGFGDVTVRLHEAKFSAREIDGAATKVAQFSSDQFDVVEITLENRDRPTPVYGIEVAVDVRADVSHTAIAAELTKVAGLPVAVNQDLKSIPAVGKLPSQK